MTNESKKPKDGHSGGNRKGRRTSSVSDSDIGKRLRIARESVRLNQSEAAKKIDVGRTTIVAMEKGARRVTIEELQKLAALYKTSANAILRNEAVHVDLVPRFRKLNRSADKAVSEAAELLNSLAGAETELENLLGINRTKLYPPERPILPHDVIEQAERNAQELRDWLGLKTGPILDIVSVLDQQLGIRVYLRKIDPKISGLFAYEEKVGACVLLNANHPVDRIRLSGAHELGHFYSTRRKVKILTEGELLRSREEKYANHFAYCFLAPAREVADRFARITAGQSHFTRRHVILLAHESGISRQAMVRRLEDLSLVRKGTWSWFQDNGGITDRQAEEVLGTFPPRHIDVSKSGDILPPRLSLLAREAWKRDFYSEGQLARLLRLGRIEVRKILAGVESEREEADGLFKLSS